MADKAEELARLVMDWIYKVSIPTTKELAALLRPHMESDRPLSERLFQCMRCYRTMKLDKVPRHPCVRVKERPAPPEEEMTR